MDSNLFTDLQKPVSRVFHAFMIFLPQKTIKLIDGVGFVSFPLSINGTTSEIEFPSFDEDYGNIHTFGTISEGITTEVPSFKITLNIPSSEAVVGLSLASNSGSPVYAYFGTVNDATGLVTGVERLFYGYLDTVDTYLNTGTYYAELNCTTSLSKSTIGNTGQKLNDAWMRLAHPNSDALTLNITSQNKIYWGGTAAANDFKFVVGNKNA